MWLSHSKKKYCEVCEHPFVFTPIYCDDMPTRLPLHVLLRQSLSRLAKTFITLARSALVIVVWLILLPTLTLWTWRFYFWSGENIGFSTAALTQNTTVNQTVSNGDDGHYNYLLSYDWKGFLSDCFQGQIITAIVVVVFVAAYLFREWVIQNTAATAATAAAVADAPEQEVLQDDSNEHLAQQQATVDDIIHAVRSVNTTDEAVLNEREQISSRLEELRREIEQRRRLAVVTDDTNTLVDNNSNINPTEYNSNTYNHEDDKEDDSNMYLNPPSGAQSPFASWRDYQQDNANSSLNHRNQQYSSGNGTWRARDFSASATIERSDYFAELYLDEAVLDEDSPSTPSRPPTPPPPPPPPPPAPPANNNDNNNNNNEAPFDFGEDFDGILEAIGMRGNVLMLLQNSILMSLMINLCLCVTVWIPYVIGRSVILIHPLKIAGSPIYVLRWISDPLIDFGLDAIFWPTYTNLVALCKTVLPQTTLISITSALDSVLSGLYFIFRSIYITLHDTSEAASLSQLLSDTTATTRSIISINNWEPLRDNIYSISAVIFSRWQQCATGQTSLDRTVCTCVGYIVLISIGSLYLSRNKDTRAGSTNEILRQQAVFLKVLFFIFLELVVFPTVCGVLLDISTLPLFTEWSIKSRFHFVLLNPYSGIFLHWFVGTGFILQFSVFIALVREVVRPGVLYFMPDPKDPQFQPVQDMVDQPILILLRKLITRAAIYFMLIMVGMGFVTILVSRYCGIYPIIWKFDTPISSLPIDLLAVQFLLPPIIRYIVPREFSKKTVVTWWHIVSRQLRLSSFMFGGRYPEEEGIYVYNSWYAWLLSLYQPLPTTVEEAASPPPPPPPLYDNFQKDGGLARVPTHDNVPIVIPRRRMIVPIDSVTLQPLNEAERLIGHPAAGSDDDKTKNTTIVYIPPYFKLRIATFLFLIWTTGSILVCSISVVPLKLGRNLFAKLQLGPDRPVHDLYSFALGAYIMILLSSMLNTAVQKYQIMEGNHGRVQWHLVKDYIASKTIKVAKFAYIFFFLGFAVPFLFGIMLDLYIIMPLKHTNIHEASLDIYPTIDWTIGVAGLSMFYGIIHILPQNTPYRHQVVQFNWANFEHLDIPIITREVILPSIKCLCSIICIPSIVTVVTTWILSVEDASIKMLIFRLRLIQYWLKSIRDDTYLIGRQLHNLEESSS
ncbi:uncharacterized protein ATC70_003395 [Mucor velutinosus]|uniref:RING-type E3 ubiquitin transferase n=1 Tax=Mucor velutinosus TaxID=708070 RepID=A0AAN7HRV6_9FUNG|nr:hypothetical protein ATC70_003395 [Mucor velutinosus]